MGNGGQMSEEKDYKKVLKLLEEGKKRKVNNFDDGLLNRSFEDHIKGDSEVQFKSVQEDLMRYFSRLMRIKIEEKDSYDDRFDIILSEIEGVINEITLPSIIPNVDDYQEKRDRIIKIKRSDDADNDYACLPDPDVYAKTIDNIRKEQFFPLTNKLELLTAKARAYLDDSVFSWHEDDWVEDIEPEKDDNNGR